LDVRIKRLQVHNQEVPQAHTGERTAINLQGVEIAQIERGDLLAQAGYFRSTYMLNVSYQHLSSADRPLENRARVRLHLGTAEYLARAVTLEKKPLLPGQSGFVQLRLESPTVCEIGDHFVIRDYSPGRTIGGGRILEVHPKKLKYLPEDEIEVLEVLEIGGSKELVETHLRRGGFQPFTPEVVARDMSRPASEIAELMEELVKDGTAIRLAGASGSWVVHQYIVAQAQEKLLATLDDFHKNTPWRLGLKRSTLAGQIFGTVDKAIYDAFLEKLVKEGQIELSGEIALRRSHKVQFNSQQEALAGKILQIYLETAFVTPEFEELVEKLEAPADKVRQVVNGLSDRGDLKEISIGVGKSLIFHTQRIEEARQAVLKLFEGKNEVAFFEVREVLNSTRKFTTPILNYFDQIGLTVRVGEIRMLKDKA
jgi:selenocysteine-specific elongation factor